MIVRRLVVVREQSDLKLHSNSFGDVMNTSIMTTTLISPRPCVDLRGCLRSKKFSTCTLHPVGVVKVGSGANANRPLYVSRT